MSYLSASENVGFSSIPQSMSDASCATQYKMAVEGVSSGSCGDVNMFLHENSGDEQAYIHLNDSFYSKYKIDPNEIYTFHDSDVIAGEITVSHTEDNFIFSDTIDVKNKLLDSPIKEQNPSGFTNGSIKQDLKNEVVSNGHYKPVIKTLPNSKDSKPSHAKVIKIKNPTQKEVSRSELLHERRASVHSPKALQNTNTPALKSSISSVTPNVKQAVKSSSAETYLDVFKREQGVIESVVPVKIETPALLPTSAKVSPAKKVPNLKPPNQAKPRRGRGPAVHEALQRIPATKRAIPIPIESWHAPGDNLFKCGPLGDRVTAVRQIESSSSDDDNMPDFAEAICGTACVEECAAESRGARLALRRAALRRHVLRASESLRLTTEHREHRNLAKLLKKQLNAPGSLCRLPVQTVNHLLVLRGMPSLLSSHDRRKLRECGWSGGENAGVDPTQSGCTEEKCTNAALPCARVCLSHVCRTPAQRLYSSCAAVFAGGARCQQPLLPLHDQTPLCAEHAWKRDNYDKMSRDSRPKKAVRKRVWSGTPRTPRRPKRRRRPPTEPRHRNNTEHTVHTIPSEQSLSELNVCSNSSTYDSSEDTAVGALSETEYVVASDSHGMEVEVGQVPADDILDPAVLSQIPDEAFTEFFNQAESGSTFAETSELAAALEAVLDERALDERVLDERALDIGDVFTHRHNDKILVTTSVPLEMSSRVPS